jgi:hypothetical protein
VTPPADPEEHDRDRDHATRRLADEPLADRGVVWNFDDNLWHPRIEIGDHPVPLSGIRVVDLTRILAGPFCTMLLADMGAEVIKIETPGQGDPLRGQGVIRDGLSWYFAAFNRNKKSLTLNLRSEAGRAALARLIEKATCWSRITGPACSRRWGFDAARLKALNPGLVVCSLSGFGDSGPYRDRPSFDFIAQAMSGFMSVTGTAGRRSAARRAADRRSRRRALRRDRCVRAWCARVAPAWATGSAPASTTA